MTIENLDGDRVAVCPEAMQQLLKDMPLETTEADAVPYVEASGCIGCGAQSTDSCNAVGCFQLEQGNGEPVAQMSGEVSLAEAVKHYLQESDGITVWMPSEVAKALINALASHPSNASTQDAPVPYQERKKLVDAIADGDWSNVSIGNKAILARAMEMLLLPYYAERQPPATVPQVVQAPTLTDDERSALVKVKWSADNLCRTVNLSVDDIKSLAAMADRLAAPQPIAASPSIVPSDRQIEAAAKVLAECMDYPWKEMPEQGKANMRKHVLAILTTASNAGEAGQGDK